MGTHVFSKVESLRCGLGIHTETGFLGVTVRDTPVWNWEAFSAPLDSSPSFLLPPFLTPVSRAQVPLVLASGVKETPD